MATIWDDRDFASLVGKTLAEVTRGDDEIIFRTAEETFRMCHTQDCCEHVYIEDICGDLNDLVGTPILQAEESTSDTDPTPENRTLDDEQQWTFYKIATIKGSVTIRWCGSSNGYYSVSVDFGVER